MSRRPKPRNMKLLSARERIAAMTEADDAEIRARREKAEAPLGHSPEARKNISEAAKKRWRKWREKKNQRKR